MWCSTQGNWPGSLHYRRKRSVFWPPSSATTPSLSWKQHSNIPCIHATLDYVCFYIQRWVHCCWTTPGWSSEMKKWIALSSAIDCFFCESLFLSFDVVRSRILRMERYNGVQSHYYDTVIGTMVIGKVALLSSSPLIKGLAEWGALKE